MDYYIIKFIVKNDRGEPVIHRRNLAAPSPLQAINSVLIEWAYRRSRIVAIQSLTVIDLEP